MHGLVSETSICYWQGQPENYSEDTKTKQRSDATAKGAGLGTTSFSLTSRPDFQPISDTSLHPTSEPLHHENRRYRYSILGRRSALGFCPSRGIVYPYSLLLILGVIDNKSQCGLRRKHRQVFVRTQGKGPIGTQSSHSRTPVASARTLGPEVRCLSRTRDMLDPADAGRAHRSRAR